MAKPYDWRNDWDWTDPDDGPASWDEYENTQEIMLDQGIPMGEQVKKDSGIKQLASNIDPSIRIEEIVKEFIRAKGRRPRSIEEIKEFYFKEMGTADASAGSEERLASYRPGDYTPEEIDMYEQYKYDMNEQKPGFPIMEIDDFLRMESDSARAGVQAGGLAGILGV